MLYHSLDSTDVIFSDETHIHKRETLLPNMEKSNTHKKWWESISMAKLFFMRNSKLKPKNLVKILFLKKKRSATEQTRYFLLNFFFRLKVHEYVYQTEAFPLIFFLASIQRLHCHLWFYLESVIPFKSIDNEKISDSIHLIFGHLFWLCLRHVRNGKYLGWMTS